MTIQIPCPGLLLQGIKNTGYKDGTQSENSIVLLIHRVVRHGLLISTPGINSYTSTVN